MPRSGRIIAIGFPHHVVQRGNNRGRIFFDQPDRRRYLDLLKKYTAKWKSSILAYCLMPNHVHLLIRPKNEGSLSKMMQGVALCYTQYVNQKYRRTGRLWESRYYSCIVGEESYLWAVVRYIEQNPRRARIVRREEDYVYSSAKAHLGQCQDDVLGEELFEGWQRKDYAEFLSISLPKKAADQIRTSTRQEKPFGSEQFTKSMEKRARHDFSEEFRKRPRHGGK